MDARHIGHEFAPFLAHAESWRLRAFARATGQTDPAFHDLAAARSAGHPELPLPPTFLFCLEADAPEPNALLRLLGLSLSQRLLHAEQGFVYHRMVYCGDRLYFRQRLDQVYEKRGGALQFAVRSTRVTNQRDELVAELRHVVVAVHGDASTHIALTAPDHSEIMAPGPGTEAIPTLETSAITRLDLAIYAGASGDHNPIHVDVDFARKVGFDDVFAHGMLVMAHAARGLTDWVPQRRLRALQLRFQRVTQVGARLRCHAHVTDHSAAAREPLLHIGLIVRDALGDSKASGMATISAAG